MGDDGRMIRNACIHLNGEQPMLADLFELAVDRGRHRCAARTSAHERQAADLRRRLRVGLLLPDDPRPVPRGPARRDGRRGDMDDRCRCRCPGRREQPARRRTGRGRARTSRSTRTSCAGSAKPDASRRGYLSVQDPVLHSRPCPRTSSSSNPPRRPGPSSATSAPITRSSRPTAMSATSRRTPARASSAWTSTTTSNPST